MAILARDTLCSHFILDRLEHISFELQCVDNDEMNIIMHINLLQGSRFRQYNMAR